MIQVFSEAYNWQRNCQCERHEINNLRSRAFGRGWNDCVLAYLNWCLFSSSRAFVASLTFFTRGSSSAFLVKLPYNGVFDNLQFSIDGSTVTLSGQAHNYVVQRDAVSEIKHLAGVTAVHDQIEVLPLSPFDDSIRLQLFRSIFRDSALNRYRLIRCTLRFVSS